MRDGGRNRMLEDLDDGDFESRDYTEDTRWVTRLLYHWGLGVEAGPSILDAGITMNAISTHGGAVC